MGRLFGLGRKRVKPLTKRQAAIVSAYTGRLIGGFEDMQSYVEEKTGKSWGDVLRDRPFTPMGELIRELAREDFLALKPKEK